MVAELFHSARVQVRGEAHLQGDPLVEDVLRQRAHGHYLAVHHLDVLDDARAVADAVRPTALQGLVDGVLAIPLS